MQDLAVLLNVLGIYGRLCHNLSTGATFIQDHEFFAEIYGFAEDSYDSVIERCIGTGVDIDIQQINLKAATACSQVSIGETNEDMFSSIVEIINQINELIESLVDSKAYSTGTEQLIGDIANQFEVTLYKLKQRLK